MKDEIEGKAPLAPWWAFGRFRMQVQNNEGILNVRSRLPLVL